jgi:hypothetical protein
LQALYEVKPGNDRLFSESLEQIPGHHIVPKEDAQNQVVNKDGKNLPIKMI